MYRSQQPTAMPRPQLPVVVAAAESRSTADAVPHG
jgi:hypothetical protein